jgi:hypothetical protein
MSVKQNQIPPVNNQSLFDRLRQSFFSTLFCAQPAKVVSYDPIKRLATIELAYILTPIPYGSAEPNLPPDVKCGVPVFQPWGQAGGSEFPVTPGDSGLAVFVDRNYKNFLEGTSPSKPPSIGYHDECFFIPGFHPYANKLPGDNQHTYTGYGKTGEQTIVRLGTKIAMYNPAVSFKSQQTQYEGNLISSLNAVVTALQEVSIEIKAMNASVQLISNKTLPVPSGGLISTPPGNPVTGSTTTQTPTLPPVSTAPLDALIVQLQTQINTTDSQWQLSFPELFED